MNVHYISISLFFIIVDEIITTKLLQEDTDFILVLSLLAFAFLLLIVGFQFCRKRRNYLRKINVHMSKL